MPQRSWGLLTHSEFEETVMGVYARSAGQRSPGFEAAAGARIAEDPPAPGTADAAVVTMPFEAPPHGAGAH